MLEFKARVHSHPMYALVSRAALPVECYPFDVDTYAVEILPKLSDLTTHVKVKVLESGQEIVGEIFLQEIPLIEVNEALLPKDYKVTDLLDYLHHQHGYTLPAGLAIEWTNSFGTTPTRQLAASTPDWVLHGPVGAERYYYELGIKDHRAYGFSKDCVLFTKPRN